MAFEKYADLTIYISIILGAYTVGSGANHIIKRRQEYAKTLAEQEVGSTPVPAPPSNSKST